jgi:hypothetical protein
MLTPEYKCNLMFWDLMLTLIRYDMTLTLTLTLTVQMQWPTLL